MGAVKSKYCQRKKINAMDKYKLNYTAEQIIEIIIRIHILSLRMYCCNSYDQKWSELNTSTKQKICKEVYSLLDSFKLAKIIEEIMIKLKKEMNPIYIVISEQDVEKVMNGKAGIKDEDTELINLYEDARDIIESNQNILLGWTVKHSNQNVVMERFRDDQSL